MSMTPVLLKANHFTTDQTLPLFVSFQKKCFHPKECLCHVYVYATALT